MLWQMFLPHGVIRNEWMAPSVKVMPETEAAGTEWRNYGRTPNGTRYAPFDQITAENLDELEVAWTFHHGDPPSKTGQDQNTPAYADGMIYSCTPNNIVNALDAETGKVRWTFDPKAKSPLWQRCRGVTYFEAPPQTAAASSDGALCATRIAVTTIDARLVSLDAKTGAPCPGFGSNGTVDLTRNMGEVKPGFYFPTSP